MSFRHAAWLVVVVLAACRDGQDAAPPDVHAPPVPDEISNVQALVDQYATVRLTADLSRFAGADRELVQHLIEAVQMMDDVFWVEAYGDKEEALALAGDDDAMRRYIEINYGPWDRLRENEPFVRGVGVNPKAS